MPTGPIDTHSSGSDGLVYDGMDEEAILRRKAAELEEEMSAIQVKDRSPHGERA